MWQGWLPVTKPKFPFSFARLLRVFQLSGPHVGTTCTNRFLLKGHAWVTSGNFEYSPFLYFFLLFLCGKIYESSRLVKAMHVPYFLANNIKHLRTTACKIVFTCNHTDNVQTLVWTIGPKNYLQGCCIVFLFVHFLLGLVQAWPDSMWAGTEYNQWIFIFSQKLKSHMYLSLLEFAVRQKNKTKTEAQNTPVTRS